MDTRQSKKDVCFSTIQINHITNYLHYKLQHITKLSNLVDGRIFFTDITSPQKEKELCNRLIPLLNDAKLTELLAELITRWPKSVHALEIEKIRQHLHDTLLDELNTQVISQLAKKGHKIKYQSFYNDFSTAFMFAVIAHQLNHFIASDDLKEKLNCLKKISIFSNPPHKIAQQFSESITATFNQQLLFRLSENADKKLSHINLLESINITTENAHFKLSEDSGAILWSHVLNLFVYLKLSHSKEKAFIKIDTSSININPSDWALNRTLVEALSESMLKAICLHITNNNACIKSSTEAQILLELIDYLDPKIKHKSTNKPINLAKTKLDAVITEAAQEERKIKLAPEFKVTLSNRLFVIRQQRSLSDPQLVSPRISPKNQS